MFGTDGDSPLVLHKIFLNVLRVQSTGWSKSSFGFSHKMVRETGMNSVANPIYKSCVPESWLERCFKNIYFCSNIVYLGMTSTYNQRSPMRQYSKNFVVVVFFALRYPLVLG